MERRIWADLLTWSRLYAVIPLTVLAQLDMRGAFLWLYAFAIATDLVDGPVARTMGVANGDGAQLDGAVDLAFAFGSLWWLFILFPSVYTDFWPYFLLAIASFVVFFAISMVKAGRPLMPHLLSGKLAMASFGLLLPVLLVFGEVVWYIHAVWIIAVVSRLEMTVFVLRGRTDMDAKSVFWP